MVRVDDNLVLAPAEAVDTLVELVEGDVKMTRVTARRLQSEPGSSDDACLHQRETTEADERRLLRHLIERHATHGKDRDAVHAVDLVVAPRVLLQDGRVQFTSAHDNVLVVAKCVAPSQVPEFHAANSARTCRPGKLWPLG